MKTNELKGLALDWAVAKCEGHGIGVLDDPWFAPSTDWAQGGAIIERECISLMPKVHRNWYWTAELFDFSFDGATPLVAAMRCYVASKLGDEVELPEGVK
jgi:hypothetical protein